MASFLDRQLDYIYFFYGLSFFLVAQACYNAWKAEKTEKADKKGLPWAWLGLFGLTHGIHELLELLARNIGDGEAFTVIRLAVLVLSYFFLLEFGRAGSAGEGGFEAKRWLFLPLVAAASLGANSGFEGLSVSVRYAFGLVGGLWASYAFFTAARNNARGRAWLKSLGVLMAAYGILTGLVVPHAPFIPASLINSASFQSMLGFPVQLARALTALALSFALVAFNHLFSCSDEADESGLFNKPLCSFRPLVMVLAILAAGWSVTNAVGNYGESIGKKNFLARAATAAAVIDPEDVVRLTGTEADDGTPVFEHIRDELKAIRAANPDCRFVYLLGMKDGNLIFLADGEPKKSKDYSPPGQVYSDALPRDFEDYKKAHATVYDPYTDSWGTWVSSNGFIKDKATGKVLAQLGMDMDAGDWVQSVAIYRLFSIIIVFVLCGLSMAFYAAWRRSRESAESGLALRLATQRLADEKRLRAIIRALGEGVIVEEEGRVAFINPEAERLIGWSEKELAGEDLYKTLLCRDDEFKKVQPEEFPTRKAIAAGAIVRVDSLYFTKKDGSSFPVSCVCSPILDEGKAAGAVITFQDITGRKQLERQKSDFYAMVTHDLKSPLTIIQGYTDILLIERRQNLDSETIMIVSSIWESCGRLLRLVNDFLTVSRLEFGKLSLNESFENFSSIMMELEEEFSAMAKKKEISFEVKIPQDLPRTVFDRMHVQRALYNLVNNALSYSPAGGTVSVEAGKTQAGDGAEFIKVSVTDSGPGIPEDEAEKIFEMYYRSPRTAGVKGSGLGLAIAKGVAAAHGGRVGLVSRAGAGSTFEFLIPVKKI